MHFRAAYVGLRVNKYPVLKSLNTYDYGRTRYKLRSDAYLHLHSQNLIQPRLIYPQACPCAKNIPNNKLLVWYGYINHKVKYNVHGTKLVSKATIILSTL